MKRAENDLIRLVDFSESPLVHYLAAARAAQSQGKHDARDNYLKAAHESNPDAELAIGVTQAKLQLAHQQTEQALATLTHLHSIAPRHDYVTMLLAQAFFELEDWGALVEILPDLRRKKLLKDDQASGKWSWLVTAVCLNSPPAASKASTRPGTRFPKALQSDAVMMRFYLNLLARQRWYQQKHRATVAQIAR